MKHNSFAVLDFGSQYTQLIARRLREIGVYSEIFPYDISLEKLGEMKPSGIILSGGPSSVTDVGSPQRDVKALTKVAPVLGICYGMQLIAKNWGGTVASAQIREYGLNHVDWAEPLAAGGIQKRQKVWMSHGDTVEEVPAELKVVARSSTGHPAALKGDRVWALQFHPEVSHTESGKEILKSFVFDMCKAQANWNSARILEDLLAGIREKVPANEHVICALSGGVDSTVVGTLLTEALGRERVHCIFVDNGLLRKDEYEDVLGIYKNMGLNVRGIDAAKLFLDALAGVEDPERKRKIIGGKFIEVFDESLKQELKAHGGSIKWLAQGTLYPDVIESVSPRGTSVTIKTHHNVGGLPEKMNLKLVEPLRELFKDEVRAIGWRMGLSEDVLGRHPFPGPGLAVRILGAVNKEDLEILRECDSIFIRELKKGGLYDKIWQAFAVLLPIRSVGVQGDGRTYGRVVSLRAVTSVDGMTADWFHFTPDFLQNVSNCITNQVKSVNRVVYDITSKPPGTIEWE
ncbi:MAG: glutamine-hydrolyzing GMP synthase [Bdellovibrionia bacterium]